MVCRFLGQLGGYVRSRSKPEGSIAQGYLAEECVSFASWYLDSCETRCNRPHRNDDGGLRSSQINVDQPASVFNKRGRALGKGQPCTLDLDTIVMAHNYILNNCDLVAPFIE